MNKNELNGMEHRINCEKDQAAIGKVEEHMVKKAGREAKLYNRVDAVMKFDNAEELKDIASKLDRAVSRPVFVRNDDKYNQTERYQGVWNKNTNTLACIASKRYAIIQHPSVIGQIANVLDTLGMNYKVTGFVRNYNNQVVCELMFRDLLIDDGKNGIMMGVRLVNSYDLSNTLKGELYGLRLACLNGMVLGSAVKDVKFTRRHVGQVDVRKEMEAFIQTAIENNDGIKALISDAMADTMEWQMATKLMEAMMANKKYRELILEEMKKLDRSKPVTRWDIYNCVTSCATHGRQITASANAYLQKKAQEILINEFDPASIEVEAQ